jgi:hypothetical protein
LSLGAIQALVDETELPFWEVRRTYEREFARLKSSARVKDYIVVLASRRARESLGRT